MKWKELKDWVENQGVTDNHEIEDIDMHYATYVEKLNIDIYGKNFVIY